MAFVGRGSLPANFQDFGSRVTQNLLLPTPTPQFVFAHWAMAGRLSLQALNAGAMTAQQYVTASGGGADVGIPADMDRLARVADMFPGFAVAVDAFGKDEGDTIKFQRPLYSVGGLSESDREMTGDESISTTGRALQSEEIPVVLKEYLGPYASDGSAPAPFAIKNFDAKYKKALLSIVGLVTNHLHYDYTYWLDTVIRDRLRLSGYTTLANASLTDASSFSAGGGDIFSAEAIIRAKQTLSDRNWKKFPNGSYACFVPTSFNTQMLSDVEYRQLSAQHAEKNQLYGYIGSIQDVDLFECSTTKQYAAASVVPGDLTGTVATGVTLEEAIMFGPGALGFGTAVSEQEGVVGPECRFADDTNYGTVAKCIWYALHAFAMLDTRGVQRILAQST